MFLSEDLPEAAAKIESGEVNLSLASRLQTFVRHEKKTFELTLDDKKELLAQIEGKSFR